MVRVYFDYLLTVACYVLKKNRNAAKKQKTRTTDGFVKSPAQQLSLDLSPYKPHDLYFECRVFFSPFIVAMLSIYLFSYICGHAGRFKPADLPHFEFEHVKFVPRVFRFACLVARCPDPEPEPIRYGMRWIGMEWNCIPLCCGCASGSGCICCRGVW